MLPEGFLSCACLFCSHALSVPHEKLLTHARKTVLKIPKENCARTGTSMHASAGSVLLPQLGSHHVHAGETSYGTRNVPSLVPFPFLPAHGHPGGNSNCTLFWGVPPLSLPLRTHGRWCGWERMVASPTEAALATVCV